MLQVRLDGTEKALTVDTKFYAHLDHGYAATVHKAQGSTVDRSYVLATPHFDRHTAYVALSRHREAATVFYAQDDFGGREGRADEAQVQTRFVERLSRSGAKDLAHDYLSREEGSAAPEVAPERGKFAGLRLGSRAAVKPAALDEVRLGTLERTPTPSPLEASAQVHRALDRYARAWSDLHRMGEQDLPVLEHQTKALRDAGAQLERARPGATQALEASLAYEPNTYQAMTQLQGRERSAKLAAGLAHEERVRADPNLAAERLVKVWQGLEAERERFSGYDNKDAREQVKARMKSLACELKRDPQLESILQQRSEELGIARGSRLDRVLKAPTMERALDLSVRDLGRHRHLGLSL